MESMNIDNWNPIDAEINSIKGTSWLRHAKLEELSDEVCAKVMAPPSQEDQMKTAEIFQTADADKDGILNLKEFLTFEKLVVEYQTQKHGGTACLSEEQYTVGWKAINCFDKSYEGVKMIDLMKAIKILKILATEPVEWTVWYFAGYGRGEVFRLLLSHANVKFRERSLPPVPHPKWPALKPTVVGNSLPQLIDKNGKARGGHARAAIRMLGLKYGYYPDDPMMAQDCDMIVDGFADVFELSLQAVFGKGFDPSTIPEARVTYFAALDKFLKFLEPYCARGAYLCGNRISIADFWVGSSVFTHFENPSVCFGRDTGEWEKRKQQFPMFKAWAGRFCAANQRRMTSRPVGLPF